MTANPAHCRALILLDLQHDFLADDGRMPVARHHVIPAVAATRAAIDTARGAQQLIIKIGNEFPAGHTLRNAMRRGAAIAGTPGTSWDPRCDAPEAVYVAKNRSDAFSNPALERVLAEHHISHLTVAGLYARACVTATARSALARGLQVELLTDAIACRSDRTRAAALRRLAHRGATQRGSERQPARV